MKKLTLLLVFLLSSFLAFSQGAATSEEPAMLWQTVLSGKVLSEPAKFSYGFCVITDARKIDCLNYEGKKLWEKDIEHPRECQIFPLDYEFLLLSDNSKNTVSLINPSGLKLWEAEITFKPEKAESGDDGRIFVYNENQIACYGINGIKKWQKSSDTNPALLKLNPFGNLSGETREKTDSNSSYQNEEIIRKHFRDYAYAFFYDKKHALICKNNWTLEYYYFNEEQNVSGISSKKAKSGPKSAKSQTAALYNLKDINTDIRKNKQVTSEERMEALRAGNYADQEILFSSELMNILDAYSADINISQFGTQIEYSIYEANTKEFGIILSQIPLLASSDYTIKIADIVAHTKNTAVLKNALREFGNCAYDPDYLVLTAIQNRAKNLNKRNEDIIVSFCDAVYEICRFMGKNAYNTKGKQILADFVYASNPDRVKAYARKTFEKIKNLQM
ncbi:hypothetical protein [Treponema sp. C6A8]|uniref:hypothetical protein n=1 Tax=Treponema sp. C6A8 TaxID=1410609 RepID=UPI00047FDE77|nr:hypothetical protein [Treponema sp. C6A8]